MMYSKEEMSMIKYSHVYKEDSVHAFRWTFHA